MNFMLRATIFLGLCLAATNAIADMPSYEDTYPYAITGNPKAQFTLGQLYREGRGVKQDNAEAAYWYRKAADQGDAHAQYNLAIFYSLGNGIPQDSVESVKWLHKAAEQGLAKAQNNLGVAYATGVGIEKNDAEAFKWFLQAANQGMPDSQISVARRYAIGMSVPQDLRKAYFWFVIAALNGSRLAVLATSEIEKQLTAHDLHSVRQAITSWRPVVLTAPLSKP